MAKDPINDAEVWAAGIEDSNTQNAINALCEECKRLAEHIDRCYAQIDDLKNQLRQAGVPVR